MESSRADATRQKLYALIATSLLSRQVFRGLPFFTKNRERKSAIPPSFRERAREYLARGKDKSGEFEKLLPRTRVASEREKSRE